MVEIEFDPRLSARENAVRYFEEAKKMKAKIEGVRKAIEDTKKKIVEEEKRSKFEAEKKKEVKIKEVVKREWFERFRWFVTSSGFLVIAGRDAKQNEVIVARHMDKEDLFFHADIHGAPATVLKKGEKEPGEVDLREAAQFAGSYSSAWKAGYGSVDVYAVSGSQVSKYSHGEYVPKGGFIISGTRTWFRNTPLGLVFCLKDEKLVVFPVLHAGLPGKRVLAVPGALDRVKAAESLKSRLGVKLEEALLFLPAGGFEFKVN